MNQLIRRRMLLKKEETPGTKWYYYDLQQDRLNNLTEDVELFPPNAHISVGVVAWNAESEYGCRGCYHSGFDGIEPTHAPYKIFSDYNKLKAYIISDNPREAALHLRWEEEGPEQNYPTSCVLYTNGIWMAPPNMEDDCMLQVISTVPINSSCENLVLESQETLLPAGRYNLTYPFDFSHVQVRTQNIIQRRIRDKNAATASAVGPQLKILNGISNPEEITILCLTKTDLYFMRGFWIYRINYARRQTPVKITESCLLECTAPLKMSQELANFIILNSSHTTAL